MDLVVLEDVPLYPKSSEYLLQFITLTTIELKGSINNFLSYSDNTAGLSVCILMEPCYTKVAISHENSHASEQSKKCHSRNVSFTFFYFQIYFQFLTVSSEKL